MKAALSGAIEEGRGGEAQQEHPAALSWVRGVAPAWWHPENLETITCPSAKCWSGGLSRAMEPSASPCPPSWQLSSLLKDLQQLLLTLSPLGQSTNDQRQEEGGAGGFLARR